MMTVEDAFQDYIRRLLPLPREGQAARRHRRSLSACLRARFDGARLIPTGSSGRGTALRRHSDADYFVALPREIITNDSAEMLKRVRLALRQTFPKSDISISKPAIVVPFGRKGCESLDIIPAVFVPKLAGGHTVYDIPNDSGGWIRSSPGAHKAYINALDESHGYKVKPLILLVKAWKVQWKVPIRSFYLEMRVARYAATVKSIHYARDIENVFESMIGPKGLADLRDPMDIGGVIRPCVTAAQEQQALQRVQRAVVRATDARKSDKAGNRAKAFERWDLFFNHKFPSYKRRS